jgi:hypothetical protein
LILRHGLTRQTATGRRATTVADQGMQLAAGRAAPACLALVHSHGPQCADTTAAAGQESAAGQRFLIGDASRVRTPGPPAI